MIIIKCNRDLLRFLVWDLCNSVQKLQNSKILVVLLIIIFINNANKVDAADMPEGTLFINQSNKVDCLIENKSFNFKIIRIIKIDLERDAVVRK